MVALVEEGELKVGVVAVVVSVAVVVLLALLVLGPLPSGGTSRGVRHVGGGSSSSSEGSSSSTPPPASTKPVSHRYLTRPTSSSV